MKSFNSCLNWWYHLTITILSQLFHFIPYWMTFSWYSGLLHINHQHCLIYLPFLQMSYAAPHWSFHIRRLFQCYYRSSYITTMNHRHALFLLIHLKKQWSNLYSTFPSALRMTTEDSLPPYPWCWSILIALVLWFRIPLSSWLPIHCTVSYSSQSILSTC